MRRSKCRELDERAIAIEFATISGILRVTCCFLDKVCPRWSHQSQISEGATLQDSTNILEERRRTKVGLEGVRWSEDVIRAE
jgi:hypothetical protein